MARSLRHRAAARTTPFAASRKVKHRAGRDALSADWRATGRRASIVDGSMASSDSSPTPLYLSIAGSGPTTSHVVVNFKCWLQQGACWWVLEPVLLSLTALSAKEHVGEWFRKRKESITAAWRHMQVDDDGWRGNHKAQRAMAKKQEKPYAPGEAEHDEFPCSSACLVGILLWLLSASSALIRRSRCEWFFKCLLGMLITKGCLAMADLVQPSGLVVACALSQGGKPCAHMQPPLDRLNSGDRELPARVADHIIDLWALSSECAACKHQLARVVATVAAGMDAGAPAKAYTTDPRRSHEDDGDAGRRVKRQRVDEDYKASVVASAVQQGAAKTPRAVIVADGKACAIPNHQAL